MSWHLQIESRLLALHSSIEPFRNLIRDFSTLTDSLSVEKRKQDSLRTERTQLTETNADVKHLTDVQQRLDSLTAEVTKEYAQNVGLLHEVMALKQVVSDKRMELTLRIELKSNFEQQVRDMTVQSEVNREAVRRISAENAEAVATIGLLKGELDGEIETANKLKRQNDEAISGILTLTMDYANKLNEINELSGKIPKKLIEEYEVIEADEEEEIRPPPIPVRAPSSRKSLPCPDPEPAKLRFQQLNPLTSDQIDFSRYLRSSSDSVPTIKLRPECAWIGHELDISEVVFSENLLYSASGDRTVKAWEYSTGRQKAMYQNQSAALLCVAVSDRLVLAGGVDGVSVVWNTQKGKLVNTLSGHTNRVTGVKFRSNTALSISHDCSIKVWDLNRAFYRENFDAQEHCSAVEVWGESVIVGLSTGRVQVWDVSHKRKTSDIDLCKSAITSVSLSADESSAVVNCRDNKIRVVDLRTMSARLSLTHKDYVNGSYYNRASVSGTELVAAGGSDGRLFVWKGEKGANAKVFQQHRHLVTCCMWRGDTLCSADSRGGIVVWE